MPKIVQGRGLYVTGTNERTLLHLLHLQIFWFSNRIHKIRQSKKVIAYMSHRWAKATSKAT